MPRVLLLALALLFPLVNLTRGEDLILGQEYQIVLPDSLSSASIEASLEQAARLLQTAFKVNGIDLPVVKEQQRDKARPGIYVGATQMALRTALGQTRGWGYVHRVLGRDLIIAGRDKASPIQDEPQNRRHPAWDRLGTVKGVTDFLRTYAGVRFLYPDLAGRLSVKDAAKLDLLASPAIEFLPTPTIAVPATLDVRHEPAVEFNTAGPARGSFYDVANNRFPFVDIAFGTHTYDRAIPVEKYFDTHPEYFALQRAPGRGPREMNRVKDGQYCISNLQVQELIYQDLITQLDRGFETVDLGQPDGFRACQCEPCKNLFGTGDDWSEKLWILHRKLAERLLAARPDKRVMMLSYILTAAPPKSFTKFPPNVRINWCGTNEQDIALWQNHEVPAGFVGYVYNWCPNLGTRYTPMRTPLFVETQVKRLVEHRVRGVFRDGPGGLYGLEGPVYYIMGRMFDDPERLQAKDLIVEFCEAAFGKERAARPMQRFYDQLYHAVELYSDHLGTRAPAWTYQDIYGKRRKSITDPFQLLGFLYTPKLLTALEAELALAEKAADKDKVKTRLALVRREFDYLKALVRVVHLTHAFEAAPDLASRDRLLDAIDARNAELATYYDAKGRNSRPVPGWNIPMFPPSGHYLTHLRLAENGYQEPYADTSLNWDTKAMRAAPLPGAKRLSVKSARGSVKLDTLAWEQAPAAQFGATEMRALFDREAIYFRASTPLPQSPGDLPKVTGEPDLRQAESLDLYLAPLPGKEIYYRFMVGPQAGAKWDAASGFIADAMDPRHAKDDAGWTGEWTHESSIDPASRRWLTMLKIPFKTLGVETPANSTFWRANFGRVHLTAPNQPERTVWSTGAGRPSMDDRNAFGELAFEVSP